MNRKIQITAVAALMLVAGNGHATRFQFVPFVWAPDGEHGVAFIETATQTGVDVPIPDAVTSFSFRGFDSGTNGFYPDLPNIVAPIWDSLASLSLFGTMTWDASNLTGFWSMRTPTLDAPEHNPPLLGGTFYRLSANTLESFWPLEYFYNESRLQGQWEAVPDNGMTLAMLAAGLMGLGVLGLILNKREATATLNP